MDPVLKKGLIILALILGFSMLTSERTLGSPGEEHEHEHEEHGHGHPHGH